MGRELVPNDFEPITMNRRYFKHKSLRLQERHKMILFVLLQPGVMPPVQYAFVPPDMVNKYNLDEINHKVVNSCEYVQYNDHAADQIMELFKRFGIENNTPIKDDLSNYVDQVPQPFTAHRVVTIGWAP
jgi:hypothetical protein